MTRADFTGRCHVIEEAYEFMLAYAAQGLPGDADNQVGGQLREFLTKAAGALAEVGDLLRKVVEAEQLQPAARYTAFGDVLERDARNAQAAVELVLAQPSISSQLVDNLNASIHLRALLTDLFLIDELLSPQTPPSSGPVSDSSGSA